MSKRIAAGVQTGIYPIKTPGGWKVIGRAFIKLYDPDKDPPALLKPGGYVKFKTSKKVMTLKSIGLNSDIGETFGIYSFGSDEQILDCITSANIVCGYHAGDHNVIHAIVKLSGEKGVAIGTQSGI